MFKLLDKALEKVITAIAIVGAMLLINPIYTVSSFKRDVLPSWELYRVKYWPQTKREFKVIAKNTKYLIKYYLKPDGTKVAKKKIVKNKKVLKRRK